MVIGAIFVANGAAISAANDDVIMNLVGTDAALLSIEWDEDALATGVAIFVANGAAT